MTELVTVLVVEDDELIQVFAKEALLDGGFESTLATSGEDAIEQLRSNSSKFRGLVTDINLAGKIDEWEVGRAAREIDPAMPVIYMTGTHGDEWASKGVPNSVLLTKPFAAAQLVTAIANLLNQGSPPIAPTA